jgi:hypothetical protein
VAPSQRVQVESSHQGYSLRYTRNPWLTLSSTFTCTPPSTLQRNVNDATLHTTVLVHH